MPNRNFTGATFVMADIGLKATAAAERSDVAKRTHACAFLPATLLMILQLVLPVPALYLFYQHLRFVQYILRFLWAYGLYVLWLR